MEAPDFEILLFEYSVDSGPVQVIDLACGEKIPEDIIAALTDDAVIKWAFNANFERVCLSQHLQNMGISLDPFHDKHPLSTECARYLNPESWCKVPNPADEVENTSGGVQFVVVEVR